MMQMVCMIMAVCLLAIYLVSVAIGIMARGLGLFC
jgi:hypothetical protein